MSKSNDKSAATERLAAQVVDLRKRAKLDNWNQFITEMQVPSDLFPALITNRAGLMPKGKAITAEECQALYNVIAGYMETNAALREHTEQVAKLTDNFMSHFKAVESVGFQINMFANMRAVEDEMEE